ncbi:hypothetical protein ACFC6U_37150 [Kitasatospora purpeofusca]|uniref:hypothetical protein n=1 Tax=Kitasatospora purpeofusca TaxID=67352 RepID=UPI0035E119C2
MGSKRKTGQRRSGNPSLRVADQHDSATATVPRQAVDPGIALLGHGRVDVNLSTGASLPGTMFDFAKSFPRERERDLRDGWGYSIELPAVLDLLDLIAAGRADPAQARDLLLRAARELYLPFEAYTFEDENVLETRCRQEPRNCPVCQAHRGWFEGELDTADGLWDRYAKPEKYPFVAGRSGLHETGCPVVRRNMPQTWARPVGDAYTTELRRYAHSVDRHSGHSDLEYSRDYPNWAAMTACEARAWMAERTGPKGGRSYKTCRRCAPAP